MSEWMELCVDGRVVDWGMSRDRLVGRARPYPAASVEIVVYRSIDGRRVPVERQTRRGDGRRSRWAFEPIPVTMRAASPPVPVDPILAAWRRWRRDTNPAIVALADMIPKPGETWTKAERDRWLAALGGLLHLLFDGDEIADCASAAREIGRP